MADFTHLMREAERQRSASGDGTPVAVARGSSPFETTLTLGAPPKIASFQGARPTDTLGVAPRSSGVCCGCAGPGRAGRCGVLLRESARYRPPMRGVVAWLAWVGLGWGVVSLHWRDETLV